MLVFRKFNPYRVLCFLYYGLDVERLVVDLHLGVVLLHLGFNLCAARALVNHILRAVAHVHSEVFLHSHQSRKHNTYITYSY